MFVVLFAISGCAATGGPLTSEIEFDGPDGNDLWKLEPGTEKAKLEDANGQELAQYRYKGNVIAVDTADGRSFDVVSTSGKNDSIAIHASGGGEMRYRLSAEPDGDYRLEDASERTLYKLKRREYGFKVEPSAGGAAVKVKRDDDKIKLKVDGGDTILSTKDTSSTLAAACLALDSLPIEVRAALAVGALYWP